LEKNIQLRSFGFGLEAQNHAAEVKLMAERKAGEMLGRLEKSEGGRPVKNSGDVAEVSEYRRVLEDTETPERDASRRQRIAENKLAYFFAVTFFFPSAIFGLM